MHIQRCRHCAKIYTTGYQTFCSLSCHDDFYLNFSSLTTCLQCQQYTNQGLFCSASCAGLYQQRLTNVMQQTLYDQIVNSGLGGAQVASNMPIGSSVASSFNSRFQTKPRKAVKKIMYVVYEKKMLGLIETYRFVFSTSRMSKQISGVNAFEQLKSLTTVFKATVPVSHYSYDPNTNIWTTEGLYWRKAVKLFDVLDAEPCEINQFMQKSFDEFCGIQKKVEDAVINPEDFFYNEPVSKSKLSADELRKRILAICQEHFLADILPEDFDNPQTKKNIYRRVCMNLHPDRNNGDGTKMSEFNNYWQELYSR